MIVMPSHPDELRAMERASRDFGRRIESESWKDDHAKAMLCKDYEDFISFVIPRLQLMADEYPILSEELLNLYAGSHGGAAPPGVKFADRLKRAKINARSIVEGVRELRESVLQTLHQIEQLGFEVSRANEVRDRLREVYNALVSASANLEQINPTPPWEDSVGSPRAVDRGTEPEPVGIPRLGRAWLYLDRYQDAAPVVFYSGLAGASLFAYFAFGSVWIGFLAGFLPVSALMALAYSSHG
jgi:hypothetical protein